MLAIELKNLLHDIPDMANILIYDPQTCETRQLLRSDIDIDRDKNLIIDIDYIVPVKKTIITHRRL